MASPKSEPSVAVASAPMRVDRSRQSSQVGGLRTSSRDQTLEALQKRREALEHLPKGSVVIDGPTTMKVGEKREFDAIAGLGISVEDLKKTLPLQSGAQRSTEPLRISSVMAATLSGPGFSIEAAASEQQAMAEGSPTVWSWKLEALEEGDQELIVTLYALLPGGDKTARQRIDSYVHKVTVNVRPQSWTEWLEALGKEFDAVKGIVVALFGMATVNFRLVWYFICAAQRSRGFVKYGRSPRDGNDRE